MDLYFLFFEKANFNTIEDLMITLKNHKFFKPVFVKGFDYKEFSGSITPFLIPDEIESMAIESFIPQEALEGGSRSQANEYFQLRYQQPSQAKGTIEEYIIQNLLAYLSREDFFRISSMAFFRIEAALQEFIKQKQPEVVILPEDTDYIRGRLAHKIFKDHGISTISLWPLYYNIMWHYPLMGERYSDYYLVWNRFSKERLLENSVPKERVYIVGHPYFKNKAILRDKGRKRLFLYPLQSIEWEIEIILDLIEIFRARSDIELTIKQHPEVENPYFEKLDDLPDNVSLFPRSSSSRVLPSACCLIGQSSIMLYEALLNHIPVIQVNYEMTPPDMFIPEMEGVFKACDSQSIEYYIDLISEGRNTTLENIEDLFPFQKDSIHRIIEVLEELLMRSNFDSQPHCIN